MPLLFGFHVNFGKYVDNNLAGTRMEGKDREGKKAYMKIIINFLLFCLREKNENGKKKWFLETKVLNFFFLSIQVSKFSFCLTFRPPLQKRLKKYLRRTVLSKLATIIKEFEI